VSACGWSGFIRIHIAGTAKAMTMNVTKIAIGSIRLRVAEAERHYGEEGEVAAGGPDKQRAGSSKLRSTSGRRAHASAPRG
jgi:hypothetical protein